MCRERFGRGEEIGRWVGSQSPSEVLRDAEGRERGDGWCAPDLRHRHQSTRLLMKPWWLTFMVFIASWACSMVSIASHSVVCGRRSWLTIFILSSEALMEVRTSGADVAIILCYALCDREHSRASDYSIRPLAKVRVVNLTTNLAIWLATNKANVVPKNDQRQTKRHHGSPFPRPPHPEGISRPESEIRFRPRRQMSQSRGRERTIAERVGASSIRVRSLRRR